MNEIEVKKKITNLEAELNLLKVSFIKRPDFSADKSAWQKVRPAMKRARKQLFKETYG